MIARMVQALLHPPNLIGPFGDQRAFVPHQSAQHVDLLFGPEGSPQQTATVQPLNPLTIQPVCLSSSWHTGQFSRIDHDHLQCVPLRAFSHAAIFSNAGVVAPNSLTSRPLPSTVGAYTQWLSLPKSMPLLVSSIVVSCLSEPKARVGQSTNFT